MAPDVPPPLMTVLHAGGSGAAIDLVPSIGTTPLSLVRLARALAPSRPVRGYAYRGLEEDGPPHTTIEAMAAAYVDELLAASPHGPYLLGGHCLGGVVALAMALDLEARGASVAALVVMDSVAPLTVSGPARYAADPASAEGIAVGAHFRRVFEDLVARTLEHMPQLEPHVIGRLDAMLRAHVDAGVAYVARPVRAPVHVLRTSGVHDVVLDGWTDIAGGGATRHTVPGDTFSMLRPPHVDVVGRLLGRVLEGST